MASSRYESLGRMVEAFMAYYPKSVLDVGVGFGKTGYLIREYLEAWDDRVVPSSWKIQLDGIEIFPDYHQDSFQHILYNNIWYGDACDYDYRQQQYDMVVCFDMLEHLPKDKALVLMDKFLDTGKHVLLSIPIGKGWLRAPYGQNPYEAHLAEWEKAEIEAAGYTFRKAFQIPDGRHVGFFIGSR
jgi:SAM-dependent methyltransferase